MARVIVPDIQGATDAQVDDVSIAKGDTNPTLLTAEQARRLEDAGVRLEYVEGDPLDALKGEALDNALREKGLPLTGTADEKRQALRNHQEG